MIWNPLLICNRIIIHKNKTKRKKNTVQKNRIISVPTFVNNLHIYPFVQLYLTGTQGKYECKINFTSFPLRSGP
jgi:hypothetical protein